VARPGSRPCGVTIVDAWAGRSPYNRSYGKYCAPLACFGKLGDSEESERRFEEASGDVGEGMVGERQASALVWR
jgi:hypothetical protein